MTISCGVAALDEANDSSEDLVRLADASLYEAKKQRNAVAAAHATQ